MDNNNPQLKTSGTLLATDLDGTLIPLSGNLANQEALIEIFNNHASGRIGLIYATGRPFDSVLEAIETYALPQPKWIICDVGSSIFERTQEQYIRYAPYEEHLSKSTGSINRDHVEKALTGIDGLALQSAEHQQRFKISYQCTLEVLQKLVTTIEVRLTKAELPYHCMGSNDPILNCGLIDVLPCNVSKAYALLWLATHANYSPDEVIYSGDSGNDYAALSSGFRAIIVANSSDGLVERVQKSLKEKNQEDRLYVAKAKATSGVLEGCQHFGLIKPKTL